VLSIQPRPLMAETFGGILLAIFILGL